MRAIVIMLLAVLAVAGSFLFTNLNSLTMVNGDDLMDTKPESHPAATFGGGCFWCLESEFRALDGVLFTQVGYMGGEKDSPSYGEVTTGTSGHVEIIEVTFNSDKVSYRDLVEFFLTKAHDPTQLDRQGVDVGTQYASVIFYHDEAQKKTSEDLIAYINMNKVYKQPIATKLLPAESFWVGEDYHQQYYEKYEEENGQPHIRVQMKKGKKR